VSLLEPVAVDIETTGFHVDDRITVVGFYAEIGCHLFLNTLGRTADEEELQTEVGSIVPSSVRVNVFESEEELKQAVTEFTSSSVRSGNQMLVGYNAERWGGGFDFPFLRTRYACSRVAWPFKDIPYVDLYPVFNKRFCTSVEDGDKNDLVSVYKLFFAEDALDPDPFEDSSEAVSCATSGEFRELLLHNFADVLKTHKLASLANRLVPKSDFQMKNLSPPSSD